MKRGYRICAAVLCAAVLLLGCEPQAERTGQPLPQGAVTVLFSADNEGVLVSCGCSGSPSGGLAKRQTVIDEIRRARPGVLLVDAGDMFGERRTAIKIKYLATALARAKYDAIGLGDQEFEMGVPQIQALEREFKLPLICANVRDAAGRPIVPPHVIREVAGVRVGIFAVIADEAYGEPPHEWRKGLTIEPPIVAARREVRELADCDMIIALSHQPRPYSEALAKSVPGIHVVIGGMDEAPSRFPREVGSTVVVASGPVGRVMGVLVLAGGKSGCLDLDLRNLSAKVPDAKWVTDLYDQYIKDVKGEPPPEFAHIAVPAAYETPEQCAKCHEPEYKQWLTTQHARAYPTLQQAGREKDPDCLLCHTAGYGREGGFASIEKTPKLGGVTCQACHPVTGKHGDPGAKLDENLKARFAISAKLCVACHGLMESPNFDYYVYKPKIVHNVPKVEKP